MSTRGYCQEAIRMSLTSEQEAAAQQAAGSSNYCNVHTWHQLLDHRL